MKKVIELLDPWSDDHWESAVGDEGREKFGIGCGSGDGFGDGMGTGMGLECQVFYCPDGGGDGVGSGFGRGEGQGYVHGMS